MSRRPIKILHVVFFLEPGGMENGIVNVAKALNGDQFDIHFCCLERGGAFIDRLPEPENVHVLGKESGFSFRTVFKLLKLIRRIQPDLLHSHNLGPLIYSGLASAFGLLCPIVQGEHSLLTPQECTTRRMRQRRILYPACNEIHTVSTQLRDQLVELEFPTKKVSVIANGVDTDHFVPGDLAQARHQIGLGHLPPSALVLGIVGRFGAFKRHAALIDAFTRMAVERKDLHLLIVGDGGPEKERVRRQAESSSAAARIHFAGFQQDVRPFYQAMDLLVVPSENEGMSNAILEAMACGVPALAHQICGNSEVITSNLDGWIADLQTVDKLEHELKNVLAARAEFVKMGAMTRAKVQNRFSIRCMVDEYAALYRRNTRPR